MTGKLTMPKDYDNPTCCKAFAAVFWRIAPEMSLGRTGPDGWYIGGTSEPIPVSFCPFCGARLNVEPTSD